MKHRGKKKKRIKRNEDKLRDIWDNIKRPNIQSIGVQKEEIEKNNRMGKTRDLFKKIRDTEGTLHAKMGTIKDKNGMDLTEAEDIKKRWQEYTELHKRCS